MTMKHSISTSVFINCISGMQSTNKIFEPYTLDKVMRENLERRNFTCGLFYKENNEYDWENYGKSI